LHTIQDLADGKVQYVGSPRWLTLSDANKNRGIWLADINGDGYTTNMEFIPTSGICSKIVALEINPLNASNDMPDVLPTDRLHLTFKGPSSWIKETIPNYQKIPNTIIKAVDTNEQKKISIRESEGLASSLKKYVHSKKWDIPTEALWSEISGRISWLRK
jgi:hypothetical protein